MIPKPMTHTKLAFLAIPALAAVLIVGTFAPASAGIPLEVFVDQKPGSCPNSVNVNSHGFLPVAILGTATFDVNDIDISSLPDRTQKHTIEDVATPFVGLKFDQFDCNDDGPDGFDDLIFKIPMEEINCLPDGVLGILIIDGALLDGTPIQGSDLAIIINKQGCS